MNTVGIMAMLSAWGVEHKDDLFYIKKTSTIADGDFKSYYPKFMGFGKSDIIATTGKIKQGKVISWKIYNKYGDVQESWDK